MNHKNRIFTKNILMLFCLIVGLVVLSGVARAIPLNDVAAVAGNAGLPRYGTFQDIILKIIQILLGVVAIISVAFIIISGYRFIISAGNEDAVTKAKQSLTWAIAGLAVTLLAWVIMTVVLNTLR